MESIEDQQKFIVPLNRDSEPLFYNKRMIIDAPVLTEPRAWVITKINRISANGLNHLTLAQDIFNQHKDYIELDSSGNVIGMWADYYSSTVTPEEIEETSDALNITYSGLKAEIKVNGSYKKFTVDDNAGTGTWSFYIGDNSVESLVSTLTNENSSDVEQNQIKVKFTGDDSYIGQNLTVKYSTLTSTSSIDVAIVSL